MGRRLFPVRRGEIVRRAAVWACDGRGLSGGRPQPPPARGAGEFNGDPLGSEVRPIEMSTGRQFNSPGKQRETSAAATGYI